MSGDKPFKEKPEFYWFRGSFFGRWPIRREGWLLMLVMFADVPVTGLLIFGAGKLGLNMLIMPFFILGMLVMFGTIVASFVRTDWR